MHERVLIVLLFHNEATLGYTLHTIDSIEHISYTAYDIVVINNGMNISLSQEHEIRDRNVIYIDAKCNKGFSAGNNFGIRYGMEHGYNFFLLLNNDVSPAPDFLDHLMRRMMSDNHIGMICPKTYYYDKKDTVWAMGGSIIKWRALIGGYGSYISREGDNIHKDNRLVAGISRHRTKMIAADHDGDVDFLPLHCTLIRREVFDTVGDLPEVYFFGYEEAEFAVNTKKAGFRVVVEPLSIAWHNVGLSSSFPPAMKYNQYRNRLIFLKRMYAFPINIIFMTILALAKMLKEPEHRPLILEAVRDHMKYDHVRYDDIIKIKNRYE